MMGQMGEWIERMWLVIALSLFGGLAHSAKSREVSLRGWICSAIVALFSGVVTHMLMQDLTSISETVRVAISSVSAYSGGVILDALQARFVPVIAAGAEGKTGTGGGQ